MSVNRLFICPYECSYSLKTTLDHGRPLWEQAALTIKFFNLFIMFLDIFDLESCVSQCFYCRSGLLMAKMYKKNAVNDIFSTLQR